MAMRFDGRLDRIVMGLRRLLWRHHWEYRNPYDRRCKTCGRHEVSHCSSMATWDRSWWETFSDGDESKHYGSHNG